MKKKIFVVFMMLGFIGSVSTVTKNFGSAGTGQEHHISANGNITVTIEGGRGTHGSDGDGGSGARGTLELDLVGDNALVIGKAESTDPLLDGGLGDGGASSAVKYYEGDTIVCAGGGGGGKKDGSTGEDGGGGSTDEFQGYYSDCGGGGSYPGGDGSIDIKKSSVVNTVSTGTNGADVSASVTYDPASAPSISELNQSPSNTEVGDEVDIFADASGVGKLRGSYKVFKSGKLYKEGTLNKGSSYNLNKTNAFIPDEGGIDYRVQFNISQGQGYEWTLQNHTVSVQDSGGLGSVDVTPGNQDAVKVAPPHFNVTLAGGRGGNGHYDGSDIYYGGDGAKATLQVSISEPRTIEIGAGEKGIDLLETKPNSWAGQGSGGGSSAIRFQNGDIIACAGAGGGGNGQGLISNDNSGGSGDGSRGAYYDSNQNGGNYISGGSGFFSGCGGGGSAQTSSADGNPGSMDIQQTGIVSTLSSSSNNGDGEASMTYYVPNQNPVIKSVYLNDSEISVGDSVKMIAEVDDPDGVVESAKFNSSSPSGDVFSDKNGSELAIGKWESDPIHINETGNYSLTAYSLTDNGGAVNKTDQTIEFEVTNAAPQITSSEFIRDRKNDQNDLIFGLDSVGREDISAYQGIKNADIFTNTTLRKNGVGMPFESVVNVSDSLGAFSSNKVLSISEQVSGLGERSGFDQSLKIQRIEKTVNLSNNAGTSVDYELITDLEGSTIQGQTFTGSIPGNSVVSHTSVTESDWIVNESQSTYNKYSDSDYNQSVDKQRIHNRTKLVATNSFDFKFEDVDISSHCSSTSIADVISGKGTVTNDCNRDTFLGDWITGEQESTESVGQNFSAQSDVDQQTLFNQTRLQVENTRGFSFNNVDVSSKCSQTQSVDVPSGTSTVTNACNNESLTGDWIKNEKNQSTQYVSGDVLFGDGLNTNFEASQGVEVTNVRTSEDLRVDVSKLVSDLPGCQLENSTTQNVPADSVSSFTFQKSCSPGQHLNRTPVIKTETPDLYKYEIEFGFKINSNVTDDQETEYAVKSSWVDNWNSRDPTETEAVVDGSGKDIQVDERIIDGTEYIVFQIGDNHTNSSIHTGTHSATLTYYESKTTGSTSGGGDTTSSGGTTLIGSSQTETQVDENNGSRFAWSVSALTSEDAQSFQINGYSGDSFEKYIVLRNEGDRNVTLDIECVSDTGSCSFVDTSVDRVVLNRNSFSEKQIKVSGTLPANFSMRDRPASFGIRVTDPDWNGTSRTGESVSYVDFTVSNSPFAGRALDLAFKVVEVREFESPFEQGNDAPYPFIFIPLFLSILTWGGVSTGEWLFAKKQYSNLKIGVTLLVFLIAFVLL